MFNFLVHIERKNVGAYDIPITRADGRTDIGRCFINDSLEVDAHRDHEDEINKWETVYCRDEVNARNVAGVLAKQRPGSHIYISKVFAVALSAPTEPIFAEYSEKGLLP